MKSIQRDIGELVWMGFEQLDPPDWLREGIASSRIGTIILFARNIPKGDGGDVVDITALHRTIDGLHKLRDTPDHSALWVSVDQEGGVVQRVKSPATVWPPMMQLADKPVSLSFEVGECVGLEIRALGFDVNFAPILDVHSNPDNPIIGNRAFGTDPMQAPNRALAFAEGLLSANIVPCGKHFPGHGDTDADSHLVLPRVSQSLQVIQERELLPFQRAVKNNLPMLMTAHVVFDAIDPDLPATLSVKTIDGILRKSWNYQGIVVSDDLDMKAIADAYEPGDAAIKAIAAGCDAVLCCRARETQIAVWEELVKKAKKDTAFRDRVGQSAQRIREAKRRQNHQDRPSPAVIGHPTHQELAKQLRRQVSV